MVGEKTEAEKLRRMEERIEEVVLTSIIIIINTIITIIIIFIIISGCRTLCSASKQPIWI